MWTLIGLSLWSGAVSSGQPDWGHMPTLSGGWGSPKWRCNSRCVQQTPYADRRALVVGCSAYVFLRGGSDSGALAVWHQLRLVQMLMPTPHLPWFLLKASLVTPVSVPQKCRGCRVLPPGSSLRSSCIGLWRSAACASQTWSCGHRGSRRLSLNPLLQTILLQRTTRC